MGNFSLTKIMKSFVFVLLAVVAVASATVYFEETFDDASWEDRWVVATEFKPESEMGAFKLSSGKFSGDEADQQGMQTSEDARFYSISSKFEEAFDNKDSDLVFQFTTKHEQNIDCGGGYLKLLPSDVDQAAFGGDSAYHIMFGSDICGPGTRRTHAIINYEGENHLLSDEVKCPFDTTTHLYRFVLSADNTYGIFIDGEEKQTGSIEDGWDVLPPKMIKDPSESKPADWVDEQYIDDPEDEKPEGYDDIAETIVDPDAEMPEDWDEELDGEWEAPMIDNPDYKGPWSPKQIKNPEYVGEWVHPEIANPDYVEDPEIYHFADIGAVGLEIWQVKSGTIFDNILVTDSIEEADAHADAHYFAHVEAEKEALDAMKEAERAEAEAARKAAEEAAEAEEAEDEDDEEEEEHDEL